jgi:hypothetical protein
MTPDQIAKRLAELQELAKQHEITLFQISGAIQELNRLLNDANHGAANATDQIDIEQSV